MVVHHQDLTSVAAVRAEGERVIAAKPEPTGREGWNRSPEWQAPPRPEDWVATRQRAG
jgi:hypothetical protein